MTGKELQRIIGAVKGHDIEVHSREVLKTAPRGYQPDHPRIELLRYKGLWAWKAWPVEPWLGTAAAKQRIADFLTVTEPLGDWLDVHVGPSTALKPASAATCSAQRSTARPSTSTLFPQLRQVRWW